MAEEQTGRKKATNEREQAQSPSRGQQPSEQGESKGLSRRQEFMPSFASWSDSPFALMRRFSEDMDRIFGDFFSDFGTPRGSLPSRSGGRMNLQQGQWAPPIEVFQQDNQLIVRAELPGLGKDDINVEVTDDLLTISGERREEHEENKQGYRHSERRYGRFSRSVTLPEGVNTDEMRAHFRNGVLEITIPTPEREQRGRRIEIQESDGQARTSSGS